MSTPEGIVKKEITDYLSKSGLLWFRMQSGLVKKGNRYIHLCPNGTADIQVLKGGKHYWIEIKAPGAKTAKARIEAQALFREAVISNGDRHGRCESLEDVKALLEK